MASKTDVDTIGYFFENAAARGKSDFMLRRASGSCRFDVEGVGSWLVRADQGAITFTEAESSTAADSILTATESDFLAMANGQQNPMTAFMQGRLKITGNLALADRFARLFP
jgi:putative sterol carrier protein